MTIGINLKPVFNGKMRALSILNNKSSMLNLRRPAQAFYVLLVIFCFASHVQAVEQTPIKQWQRSSAMAAVHSVDIDIAVREIGDTSSLADGTGTLIKLTEIENRSHWPLPAREAAIYQFTRSLSYLPRDAVAIEVMQYLHDFEAQVLVPHEDHTAAFVPMFNIRGAAAGVENGWQRSEWASRGTALIEADPATMVSGFVSSTNHNQRSGLIDALQQADIADVELVQGIALKQFEAAPQLMAMIATTAVITTDGFAIRQLLINGRGAGLSSALVQLDIQLPTSETAELLMFAIEQAPAGNAALAIAAWWPRLKHESATRELLVNTLANPNLGADAALALAQNPDIQTIKLLQDTAKGSSSAARRAQMALDINRAQLIGEVQR